MTQLHSSLPAWRAVEAHARDLAARICAISPPRIPSAGRICTSSTTAGCSISRASESRRRPWRCCSSSRARWICRRASPPCFAAIRSMPPRGARCCTPRCARTSPARRRFKRRSRIRAASSRATSARCAAATKRGVTGKKFKHVVNVGIGGSDLGPLLVCNALRAEWSGDITPHFVSNVDRTQLEDLMRSLDPAETLVIVCSKTFTTQETQANANAARAWIVGALGETGAGASFRRGVDQRRGHGRLRHRARRIASPCGIGWAAATRSGRRSA